mgnify:CR=1 FL=1
MLNIKFARAQKAKWDRIVSNLEKKEILDYMRKHKISYNQPMTYNNNKFVVRQLHSNGDGTFIPEIWYCHPDNTLSRSELQSHKLLPHFIKLNINFNQVNWQ